MTPARLNLGQSISRDGQEITRAEVQVVAIKTSGGVARMPRDLVDLLKA